MVGVHRGPVRRWPGVVAVFLVGLIGFAAPAVAQAGHADMEHGNAADGILPPGDWTEEQVEFATDLVRRTEVDLQAYADYAKVPSMGFNNFGINSGDWLSTERISI